MNCVSAVRKVIFDVLWCEIPKARIGNMPRKLLTTNTSFKIIEVEVWDIHNGDLIFVGKNRNDCLHGEYYPLSIQILETFVDKRSISWVL